VKSIKILLLAPALLGAALAHATPTLINAGINGFSGTVDCRVRTTGTCTWNGALPSGYSMDGSVARTPTSATTLVVDPLRGTASSAGYMNATSYLPELHAYASSNSAYSPSLGNSDPSRYTGVWSAFADANIWGVQGYQYNGVDPFELTVTAKLDSIFSADGKNGRIGHSGFRIGIFDANGYLFDYGDDDMCPLFTDVGGCIGTKPAFDVGAATLYDTGSMSVTISHRVNSGDRFYVGATLDANVCCGQAVDSSHTLQMAFNDFRQLSSIPVAGVAAAAVPEPGSALSMVTGLGIMALCVKRRRWRKDAPRT
jgi:hypothetical protein